MYSKFYKPETLPKLACTSRDPRIRGNALKKLIDYYGDCQGHGDKLGDILCFSNYEDTREKTVQKLVSDNTISSLAILREAKIDSNFKDTKEIIARKLTETDHYRRYDRQGDSQALVKGVKLLVEPE